MRFHMENKDQWQEILEEALRSLVEKRDRSVTGATLQPAVSRAAAAADLEFPPVPEMGFQEFLLQFPSTIWVFARPGQDFLAVPAGRADLLMKEEKWLRIRRDLFGAFTRVSTSLHNWYLPTSDQVVTSRSTVPPDESAITITGPTIESEVELRKDFINDLKDEDMKAHLEQALSDQRPFSAFSKALHGTPLISDWHQFRFVKILERVRSWATEKDLPWNESWIELPPSTLGQPDKQLISGQTRERLAEQIADLSNDDLARIKIPADIVARMIRGGRDG